MNEAALLYTLPAVWWGYAEAEPTLVGVLVAVIAVLAVIYVITRLVRGRGPRARPGKKAGSRR